MFDLDLGVRARHLDAVIAALHVCREVGQKELSIQQERQVPEERFETYRGDRALEERSSARLVRKFRQRTLAV